MARIVTNSNLSYSAKYRIFNAIVLNMRYSFYTFIPFAHCIYRHKTPATVWGVYKGVYTTVYITVYFTVYKSLHTTNNAASYIFSFLSLVLHPPHHFRSLTKTLPFQSLSAFFKHFSDKRKNSSGKCCYS